MKVRGKLTIKCEKAGEMISVIARSLSPDNVSGMRTEVDKDSVTVTFSADKIGTMLSSVDDYLMNANIALSLFYIKKQDNQDLGSGS
jgi:hypothetical protein